MKLTETPIIKVVITTHVEVASGTISHLSMAVGCISWCRELQHGECAKDDLATELRQFIPKCASKEQKVTVAWLKKLLRRLPKRVEYIKFCAC
jgi:hypothetical protein